MIAGDSFFLFSFLLMIVDILLYRVYKDRGAFVHPKLLDLMKWLNGGNPWSSSSGKIISVTTIWASL